MLAQEQFSHRPICEDAPHGSAILNEEPTKFGGCSARERDFSNNIRMLRTGGPFYSIFSGCSARERDFIQNLHDAVCGSAILIQHLQHAPHGSAIFLKIFRMLRTGARFYSTFSGCSARERDFERRSRESYTEAIPERSALLSQEATSSEVHRDSFSIATSSTSSFINDQNFPNAPHGSAILQAMKTIKTRLSRAGTRFLSKQNLKNFRMSPTGARFFKIGARPVRLQTPLARLL